MSNYLFTKKDILLPILPSKFNDLEEVRNSLFDFQRSIRDFLDSGEKIDFPIINAILAVADADIDFNTQNLIGINNIRVDGYVNKVENNPIYCVSSGIQTLEDNVASTIDTFTVPNPGAGRGVSAILDVAIAIDLYEEAGTHLQQTLSARIEIARTNDENTAVAVNLDTFYASSRDGVPTGWNTDITITASLVGEVTETQTLSIQITKDIADDLPESSRQMSMTGFLINSTTGTENEVVTPA